MLLFFHFSTTLCGQVKEPYNIYNYSVNEGLLQTTISDICFDKDNFLWVGFANGLQRFDGVHFNAVPEQPGLPDDKRIRFFKTSHGDLWLAHKNGISRYLPHSNKFILLYSSGADTVRPLQFIGEQTGVVYIFTPAGHITGIDINTYKITSDKSTRFFLPGEDAAVVKFSTNITENVVAVTIGNRLYRWHLQQQKLVDSSAAVPGMLHYFLYLKNKTEVLYYSNEKPTGLMLYHFENKTNRPLLVKETNSKKSGRCFVFKWQGKTLVSLNNHLYETDTSFNVVKKELVNFQLEPAGNNLTINHIAEDNFGNLWLQTVTGGLKKISRKQYPLRYYGIKGKDNNNIISLLPDKAANKILAGTAGNGLLVYDTLMQLVKHIRTLPGSEQPFTTSAVVKANDTGYLLFINGENRVWQLSASLSSLSSLPIKPRNSQYPGVHYFGNPLYSTPEKTVVQTQGKIFAVPSNSAMAEEFYFSKAYIMSGLQHGSYIISHGNNELLFLDTVSFNIVKRVAFPNTGYVRCFAKSISGDTIYIGSNKGVFAINSKGQMFFHLDRKAGLPDECIYAMAPLADGSIWCSSNKGLFRISAGGQLFQLKKQHGIQESEFNTNAVGAALDGELFFGGVNGITSFYPGAVSTEDEKVKLLFTSMQCNNRELFTDTAISFVEKLDLPYDKNSLSFRFTVMGASAAADYVCQYKMKGIDEEWLTGSALQTIHYFLPPGDYTLQLYADAAYDANAKPLKELTIHIAPPFWKTWWFTVLALLALLAAVIFGINRYTSHKYRRKLMAMEAEHTVQLERERISRDLHDSIGAYANAVLYNTELLQQQTGFDEKNELMNDLKFASKDIINALRDTVWALKKETYTAEDCLIRIRNFIQPFNRYYEHINFTVEGEAPPAMNLNHAHALNLVRIVQEAVTNAIKHAGASFIKVTSEMENGSWKLSIADDGKGFLPGSINKDREGNGLGNMKQRATDSRFGFRIDSAEGEGTVVTILV